MAAGAANAYEFANKPLGCGVEKSPQVAGEALVQHFFAATWKRRL